MINIAVLSFSKNTDDTWAWQTYDDLARQMGYCVGYPDLEAAIEGALNNLMSHAVTATQPGTPPRRQRRKGRH